MPEAAHETQPLTAYYAMDPLYRGGYAFGIEKAEHVLGELIPLHKLHWEDTERRYFDEDMNPDYERYIAAERDSKLVMFTIRDIDTALVGHVAFVLGPHHNAKHVLLASEQVLFIHPDHRGRCVIRLLDYAEGCLRRLGVQYVTLNDKSPSGGASLAKLVGRRGYKPFAVAYMKKLGD